MYAPTRHSMSMSGARIRRSLSPLAADCALRRTRSTCCSLFACCVRVAATTRTTHNAPSCSATRSDLDRDIARASRYAYRPHLARAGRAHEQAAAAGRVQDTPPVAGGQEGQSPSSPSHTRYFRGTEMGTQRVLARESSAQRVGCLLGNVKAAAHTIYEWFRGLL